MKNTASSKSQRADVLKKRLDSSSIRRLAAVVIDSNDAITVQDLEGKISEWNRGAERMYGYTESEARAMNIQDTIPLPKRQEVLEFIAAAAAVPSFETQRVTKDGRTLDVWLTVTKLVDDAGKTVGIATTERDITERKKIQQEIEEARLYAEGIIETMREALIVLSPDLKVLSANAAFCQIFKVNPKETRGQFIYDLGNRQWDIPKLRTLLQEILPKKNVVDDYEVEHHFETIGLKTMLLNARHAANRQMIIITINDITERKRAEEEIVVKAKELAESNKELEEFAYFASHDLQEPIRKMVGFSQLFDSYFDGKLEERPKEYLNYIIDGAKRMQLLIQDLLQYSQAGQVELHFEEVDFNLAVKEALSNLETRIKENQAVIIYNNLPALKVHKNFIISIFQNLIGNSLKYRSEEAPHVEISAKQINREWEFGISDNGIGIEPEFINKLFFIFQRLHSKSEYEGTGIGLALCKRLIERHDGKIWIEPHGGKGAIFKFTLPIRS